MARPFGGLEAVDDEIQKISGKPATIVPLDLRQADMIDALGAQVYERFGKLDILVGNAATLGTLSPIGRIRVMGLWQLFYLLMSLGLLLVVNLPFTQFLNLLVAMECAVYALYIPLICYYVRRFDAARIARP
jgi:NAD(P)-dependent dehydrogenase (short-subunit alcohol dehydrogenase family)